MFSDKLPPVLLNQLPDANFNKENYFSSNYE